jgi:hypothetical protein
MTFSFTPDFAMPESMLPEVEAPLAVVCYDAGATNLVFAWLRTMADAGADACQWRLSLEGPALRLWQQSPIAGANLCSDFDAALGGARTLISGTGWATRFEHEARCLAANHGLRSIAVIDHWVNYRARFERDGQLRLPDEVWVADEFALREAQRALPEVPARQLPNLYLAECAAGVAPLTTQSELLYVLEPVRADWAGVQGGEFAALDFFACNFAHIDAGQALSVRLRPHPSDAPGKYDAWIASHSELAATLDDSPTLAAAIGRASVVCGAETFAMVVALAAGRRVLSTLPPQGHRCRLPQTDIVHLRDLVATQTGGRA